MKYKFEDIIFNITEKKKPVEEDKYNYIGLEHLESGNLFISKWGSDTAPEGEKIVMKKGDVLFGKRRAYQKKVAISPIDGIFSAHGMVLRPKEDVICKEFLPFFISSEAFLNEAIRISVGGLSPTVNWKDIKELEFDLPSLAEQKVLAEKLWAAYELKQSYLKMIAATEEMVKAQFVEMFGSYGKRVKIGDRCSVSSGKSIPTKLEDIRGDIAYVKVADFNLPGNEKYIYSSQRYVAEESAKYSKMISTGSVIFAKNGAASLSNKKRLTKIDCCIDMNTLSVKSTSNDLKDEFLFAVLQSLDISEHVRQGAIPSISPKSIENCQIPYPTLEEQDKYISIAEQADKSISELRKSVDAIDKVIKSLINEKL